MLAVLDNIGSCIGWKGLKWGLLSSIGRWASNGRGALLSRFGVFGPGGTCSCLKTAPSSFNSFNGVLIRFRGLAVPYFNLFICVILKKEFVSSCKQTQTQTHPQQNNLK